MNVLVLGAQGQVARCLHERLPQATCLGRAQLDLEQLDAIRPALTAARPDFIVNAAAYTAVDAAESDRERARRLNADAVREIAIAAAELAVPLLHISTDYVFSGEAGRPYREEDATGPLNVYGETKLEGERAVAAHAGDRWWVLRTSSVFSEHGHNFVKTMLRLAGEGRSLTVVADQVTRPTYAGHIADAIVQVLERHRAGQPLGTGVYHCASHGEVSWFELARATFERAVAIGRLERMPELAPIASADYATAAMRPRYSVLDTRRFEAAAGWVAPHWRDGLEATLEALTA